MPAAYDGADRLTLAVQQPLSYTQQISPRSPLTAGISESWSTTPSRSGDANDLLGDGRNTCLGRGDHAVTVLVRLLICQDRTDVRGCGEFLDRCHRFGHVEGVVIGDRQLIGFEGAGSTSHRMQCVGGLIGSFTPGDALRGGQGGIT